VVVVRAAAVVAWAVAAKAVRGVAEWAVVECVWAEAADAEDGVAAA
jgi:hypothetical protein